MILKNIQPRVSTSPVQVRRSQFAAAPSTLETRRGGRSARKLMIPQYRLVLPGPSGNVCWGQAEGPIQMITAEVSHQFVHDVLFRFARGDRGIRLVVQQGEAAAPADAFTAIVKLFEPVVRSVAAIYRVTEWSDLAQETFLKIWRFRDQYDAQRGDFLFWFQRIAHNVTKDHLRKLKNSRLKSVSHCHGVEAWETQWVDPKTLQTQEPALIAVLGDRIASLSENLQAPLRLRMAGMSNLEGARALQMSLSSFKVRLQSALGKLRSGLQSYLQ